MKKTKTNVRVSDDFNRQTKDDNQEYLDYLIEVEKALANGGPLPDEPITTKSDPMDDMMDMFDQVTMNRTKQSSHEIFKDIPYIESNGDTFIDTGINNVYDVTDNNTIDIPSPVIESIVKSSDTDMMIDDTQVTETTTKITKNTYYGGINRFMDCNPPIPDVPLTNPCVSIIFKDGTTMVYPYTEINHILFSSLPELSDMNIETDEIIVDLDPQRFSEFIDTSLCNLKWIYNIGYAITQLLIRSATDMDMGNVDDSSITTPNIGMSIAFQLVHYRLGSANYNLFEFILKHTITTPVDEKDCMKWVNMIVDNMKLCGINMDRYKTQESTEEDKELYTSEVELEEEDIVEEDIISDEIAIDEDDIPEMDDDEPIVIKPHIKS